MTTDEIKATYKVPQILSKYGVSVKKGWAICPFHTEKTASLKVKEDYCHCYGCGRHDDIFSITMFFENCDFKTAASILGSNKKPTLTKHRRVKDIVKERSLQQSVKSEKDEQYWKAYGEWIRLDDNLRDFAPPLHKNLDINKLSDSELETLWKEALHPLYIEAIQKIDFQKFLLDSLY